MKVALVAVGTELLLGDVVNTNAAWLGRALADAGLDVHGSAVVGDNVPRIVAALRSALDRADAVLVTGGLGPTRDDVTREALATLAGEPLVEDPDVVAGLREWFGGRGRRMPEGNLRQARRPASAQVLANPVGTAPGLRLEVDGRPIYAVPGVPHEMVTMATERVLPELRARAGAPAVIASRTVRTAGLGESTVAERLLELHEALDHAGNPTLAYLAGGGEVSVRITAKAADAEAARALIDPVELRVRASLGPAVYGGADDSLEDAVHRLLRSNGATVAVAESLTGGLLGAALTTTPGASETFRGGVLVYASDLKETLAGVPGSVLAAHGPVSPEVAAAMAAGVRQRCGATFGLALTGVAGPDAQAGQVPGTVLVALDGPAGGRVRNLRLTGDRARVRGYAVTAALDLLRRELAGGSGSPGPPGTFSGTGTVEVDSASGRRSQ